MRFWNINLAASVDQVKSFQSNFGSVFFSILCTIFLPWVLYQIALPRPIPGIPYRKPSGRRLLGDVPDLVLHMTKSEGTFITFILEVIQSLNAPMVQVFYSPLRKPIVILADYRETSDLMRRKDFDRSSKSAELIKYLGPDHHIRQRTNARFRAQRRLIQDSMSPAFLHGVAGPTIHRQTLDLVELWRVKSRIARGRPFAANDDLDHAVLDAVLGFAFGAKFPHSAIKPALKVLKGLDADAIEKLRGDERMLAQTVEFPVGDMDEVIRASLDVTKMIEEVQGSIWPGLRWEYVIRKPRIKRAREMKDAYVIKELKDAAQRMQNGTEMEMSAVDHMVRRAKSNAEKEGKVPNYCSRVMIDEAFGFVIAGADTTSTSLCWSVKILADNPSQQTKLRDALLAGHARARSERRSPTSDEITSAHIPYVDAWIEEALRTGGTIPMVDREALVDTQVLGYHIPKGTDVLCLQLGPSMMSAGFQIDEAKRSAASQTAKNEGRYKAWDLGDIAVFKPERWLKTEDNGVSFDPNAGPQLAFGLGPRSCCGKKLAYLEMKVMLTLLVWNFELLVCPRELSGYGSVMLMTSRPRKSYVRLREVNLSA